MIDLLLNYLHVASRWFESFADRHQHSVAALSAFSTTAAVIVALWAGNFSRTAAKPKLKARVSFWQIVGERSDLGAMPTYVAVRLTNVGKMPIRLQSTCFSWRIPPARNSWAALPVDEQGDGHIGAHQYPFILHPNTSDTLFLASLERFHAEMPKILSAAKLLPTRAAKKLRAYVYTDDGSLFRADISEEVTNEIAEFEKQTVTTER